MDPFSSAESVYPSRRKSDITPGLDVKQPKVVAGTFTVLKELVRSVALPSQTFTVLS